MIRRTFVTTITILITFLFVNARVLAIELVVSGNGSNSTSEVQVQVDQQTTVQQTNDASVNNDVNTVANTGDNEANSNTGGDVQIQTGDVTSETAIHNDLNTSVIDIDGCCPQETSVSIEGNGSGSTNTVDLAVTNNTFVSVSQTAVVTNQVSGSANTGSNTANNNGGNVTIDTGNIDAEVRVTNSANHARIEVASCCDDVRVKIAGNGDGSANSVHLKLENETIVEKNDLAEIDNILVWDANTGGNEANGNLGDVSITTGNIDLAVEIVNGPINFEWVTVGDPRDPGDIGGPEDPGNPPTETPSSPPAPPSVGSSNNNGSSSGSGNDDDDADGTGTGGAVLPATGSFLWLLAMLANIAMFLLGVYLRLRSGRSPGSAASRVRA